MAMNKPIRLLQITIKVREDQNPGLIQILADEHGFGNPAAATFRAEENPKDPDIIKVLKDLADMLLKTDFSKEDPLSLCIEGTEIRTRSECSS